jgi:hypothetical protein
MSDLGKVPDSVVDLLRLLHRFGAVPVGSGLAFRKLTEYPRPGSLLRLWLRYARPRARLPLASEFWRKADVDAAGPAARSSTLDRLGLFDELVAGFDRTLELRAPRLDAVLYLGHLAGLVFRAEGSELALHFAGVALACPHGADRLVDLVNGLLELLNEFVQGCHVILPAGLF